MEWLLMIGIFPGSILLVFLIDAIYKRKARKKIAGRPRRSSLEFGQTFYPANPEIAAKVRDILSENLPVDLSQLEPKDQPVFDLYMDALDSMATLEFIIALEEEFGISIDDIDAEKMRTFDDVCKYVIAMLEGKKINNQALETKP